MTQTVPVTFDKETIDAVMDAHWKRRAGADAVCQAMNALVGKRYPERGSFTVVCHKHEDRRTKKSGDYSLGYCVGGI